jgi:hypothetical protein
LPIFDESAASRISVIGRVLVAQSNQRFGCADMPAPDAPMRVAHHVNLTRRLVDEVVTASFAAEHNEEWNLGAPAQWSIKRHTRDLSER